MSIICWSPVSSMLTRSGRSPVDSPARNLLSVSTYVDWLTTDTWTSFCDELNLSTRRPSASSLARWKPPCQYVMSTGLLLAFFSAPSGHFPPEDCAGAAPAMGMARPTTASTIPASAAVERLKNRDIGTPVLGSTLSLSRRRLSDRAPTASGRSRAG